MNIKRRDFLRYGSMGLAGLTLNTSSLSWLVKEAQASGTAWKFGVMADTQWRTGANAGDNPASCAVGVINALNQQFISHGVKFVVQVGDLVDVESVSGVRTLPTRAAATQALYDAGIGFFPVRGNHEGSTTAANEFNTIFPQTTGDGPNMFGVSNVIDTDQPTKLLGLSYAFDFDNVRIVLIDQFTRKDGTNYNNSSNNNAVDQVAWVDGVLSNRSSDMHAFVMAHKNLSGQNHKDCLFGSSVTSNSSARNQFIASLQANKVGYYLGGHDHMHYRSIVPSPDASAAVEQVICSSNSYKFYIPKTPYVANELALAHEMFTLGYYIFTIDGPCVTVDFYSSSHGADYGDLDLVYTPTNMTFYLRESFGYSLNGKSFTVAQGESYSTVQDTFNDTSVRILSGTNGNTETDFASHQMVKTVKTGWTAKPGDAASAVLKLWGLVDNLSLYNANLTGQLPDADEADIADTYCLSISYDASRVRPTQLRTGKFCIQAKNDADQWVNAVDLNAGGIKKFVYGPYSASYGLGTYGVDASSKTVWAVIDHDGTFVAK